MKQYNKLSIVLTAGIIAAAMCKAQQQLPEIKFPAITGYTPKTTKGWVGQYVYELHFFDSLSYKSGKYEKRLWIRADNIYTGYIEFPTEIKGAIRRNQPDKNNITRWESWIGSGTPNSWSVVNDTIKRTDPLGGMGSLAITGKMETVTVFSSAGKWIKGWMNNADMQIDHTEKKYTLAVPIVTFDIEGTEQREETYFNPAKKIPFSRTDKGTKNYIGIVPLKAEGWDIIEGSFTEDQQEIIIRKRIPVSMGMEVETGNSTKLLTRKGYMDFYLVLKKAAPENKEAGNKTAAANTSQATEPASQKTSPANTGTESSTKKTGLGSLTKKLGNILKNN